MRSWPDNPFLLYYIAGDMLRMATDVGTGKQVRRTPVAGKTGGRGAKTLAVAPAESVDASANGYRAISPTCFVKGTRKEASLAALEGVCRLVARMLVEYLDRSRSDGQR